MTVGIGDRLGRFTALEDHFHALAGEGSLALQKRPNFGEEAIEVLRGVDEDDDEGNVVFHREGSAGVHLARVAETFLGLQDGRAGKPGAPCTLDEMDVGGYAFVLGELRYVDGEPLSTAGQPHDEARRFLNTAAMRGKERASAVPAKTATRPPARLAPT